MDGCCLLLAAEMTRLSHNNIKEQRIAGWEPEGWEGRANESP
jgi:hypothetical protein